MALTDAGRQLTEEHRLAQLAIAANAAIVSDALWSMLDPYDLDGSRNEWLATSILASKMHFDQSASVAESYVSAYQAVEVPGTGEVVVMPRFSADKIGKDLDLAGPQYIKSLIREGRAPEDAHSVAHSRLTGVARKHSMDGGRGLIDGTTAQDRRAIGYRRVTDSDPCSFCAMLASRGAYFGSQRAHSVYSSADTALVRSGDGLRYHLHCACTAEIVYENWIPNEREQVYVDAYERAVAQLDAAGEPRSQGGVLSLMRADNEANFRDNLERRRKSPDSL